MHKSAPLLFLFAATMGLPAAETAPQIKPGARTVITFKGSVPLASAEQLKLRLRSREDPAPYELSKEQFEILLPKNYKSTEACGLFIWISPGPKPSLPPEWDKVLEKKKLIFIGAFNSGNNREVFDRIRLAVDANHHVRQLYDIDAKRVYISGHSGGSRVASMLGVAYADMFTGAACFMGVNYCRNLTGEDGTAYEMRYMPHPEIATQAVKEGHFALVTGEKDSNLENTKAVYKEGFVKDEFAHVKLFNIPNQPHSLPSADWLDKVVDYLDKGK